MNLYDAIFYRKTTQEFSTTRVKNELLKEIENICLNLDFIDNNNNIKAHLIDRGHLIQLLTDKKCIKAPHYILITSEENDSLIDVGFACEDLVLKLTILGVATSYIEVNFSYDDIKELITKEDEKVVDNTKECEDEIEKNIKPRILIAFGYSTKDYMFRDKNEKLYRKPFKNICKNINKNYEFLLEPIQLAPSYKNCQPWVMYNERNTFNIYSEKQSKIKNELIELSIGAFIKHFDLAIKENKKSVIYQNINAKKRLRKNYCISAIINNDVDINR